MPNKTAHTRQKGRERGRLQGIAAFFLIAFWLIAIDRLSKSWAADTLHQGVVGYDFGPIAFTLVHNRGAAFGMGQGSGILFVGVAAVIVIAILAWLFLSKEYTAFEFTGMALVFAGGIGNAVDRLTTGYVVDFIEFTFIDFPVFNVADICVTCGVVIVLVAMLRRMRSDEVKERAESAMAQTVAAQAQGASEQGERKTLRAQAIEAATKQLEAKEEPKTPEDLEWEADVAAYEAQYESDGAEDGADEGIAGDEHGGN